MERLTKAEEEVMQIIWKLERCTVSQIIEEMELDPKPAHSTISTFVRLMEKKGYLDHKAYGKTHEYFPIVSKDDYSKRTINKIVSDYFDGSMNRLVSFLVQEKGLDKKELNKILDEME